MSLDTYLRPYRNYRRAIPSGPQGRLGGDRHEVLRRHEVECKRYGRLPADERRSLHSKLLSRIADTSLLRIAVEHVLRNGGGAPGPNGQRLAELWTHRRNTVYRELTRLKRGILDGSYRPSPPRIREIPKPNGQTRPIAIFNWQDLVVQRSIAQIAQPLVDPTFARFNFGFRPRRDRNDAVATAIEIANRDERFVWLAADIQDAFGNVPHDDLIDLIEARFPNTELRNAPDAPNLPDLIAKFPEAHPRTMRGRNRFSEQPQRGISQGGGLSPLLLNFLLDATLDQAWLARHQDLHLIRYVDDLLIPCGSREEGLDALHTLRELLPGGMWLKGTPENDITDLRAGQTVEWLGWDVSMANEGPVLRPPEWKWTRLEQQLRLERESGDFPLYVPAIVQGFVDHLGPCYEHVDREACVRRIRRIANGVGAEEIPEVSDFLEIWDRSHRRFQYQRRLARRRIHGDPDEGAGGHDGFADREPPRLDWLDEGSLDPSSIACGCPFNT